MAIVGFWALGWTLGSSAERMARDLANIAVVDASNPLLATIIPGEKLRVRRDNPFNHAIQVRKLQSLLRMKLVHFLSETFHVGHSTLRWLPDE